MALSGTSLTVTTLTTAGLLTNNTSGQVSSVTGSTLAALLGGAPTFTGLKLSGLSSVMLKVDGSGNIVQASAVTDYQTPITAGNNMAYSGANLGTVGAPSFSGLTLTNLTSTILKVNGSGIVTGATLSDYQLPMAAGTNLTLTGVTFATVAQPSFAGINCVTVGSQNIIYGTSAGSLLSGSSNILIGYQAAQNLTTGTYNTYIGTNASASSATVTGELVISSTAAAVNGKGANTAFLNYSSGLYITGNVIPNNGSTNVGIGLSALNAVTTGTYNIGVGSNAGRLISTGSSNVLVGYQAGNCLTLSSQNIAIGSLAMGGTGTVTANAAGNIAIGTSALFAATTTASNNIAIGANSSVVITTGTNNIAIGYNSLYNATNCSDNICFGTNAGNSITTGGGNIAIGGSSLSTGGTLTAGQGNNIGIGIASNLYVSAGATNNIGLGAYSNLNTSTGVSNISIGPYTQASSATGSNQITISTNGTSGTPISGKGNNTAFIDARSGLYSYMPAYGHFSSSNITSNLMYWNTTYFNQNISVSNQTVTFAIAGLYEITFSGSVQSVASGAMTGALRINGVEYTPSVYSFFYGAHGGAGTTQAISFTIMYRMAAASTMYMATGNLQGNAGLPTYLTIRYLGL
jgi:hypothetical protein